MNGLPAFKINIRFYMENPQFLKKWEKEVHAIKFFQIEVQSLLEEFSRNDFRLVYLFG